MHRYLKFDLIEFLARGSHQELKNVAILSLFAGISNTALISLINYSSHRVSEHLSVTWHFFIFAALLLGFMYGTAKVSRSNVIGAQALIHKFKIKIMGQVFKSQLIKVNEIGRGEILQLLARDAHVVSQGSFMLIGVSQAIATVVFLTFYMAFISWLAFVMILASTVLFFVVSLIGMRTSSSELAQTVVKEKYVNSLFDDFLSGYQEVKMDSRRARDITRQMIEKSRESSQFKGEVLSDVLQFFNYMQVLMFVVVGLLIYLVPELSPDFSEHVLQATTTSLFLVSSLTVVVQTMPSLTQANLSARSLIDLERRLSDEEAETASRQHEIYSEFKSLTFQDICFDYTTGKADTHFKLGPISYQFEAGKVYFIRGRNGAGKTTMIRLLTGLYTPQSGQIMVNAEQVVSQPSTSDYRDLFAVVFSDFHLFKKTFGLNHISDQEVTELLKQFEIEAHVRVRDGEFSTVRLSSGQRKRLALVVALLCKKPIMVLDEWAADQDPQFRKEFYDIIIPRLRAMGKTVIAITHDDQYYSAADKVLSVSDGVLVEEAL
jgi:putative ATP-binding cassette transporter